jgi:CBS domain containing-hemolysin-like protein
MGHNRDARTLAYDERERERERGDETRGTWEVDGYATHSDLARCLHLCYPTATPIDAC